MADNFKEKILELIPLHHYFMIDHNGPSSGTVTGKGELAHQWGGNQYNQ